MPIRPIDVQGAVQQSGTAASQQAARAQAPFAAQVQSEIAEPNRAARRQETVARNLKGEAHAVGERPSSNKRQQGQQQRRRRQSRPEGAAPEPSSPDGKGRVLDIRL